MCFALCSSWLCLVSAPWMRFSSISHSAGFALNSCPFFLCEHWHIPDILRHFCSCGADFWVSAEVRYCESSGTVWIKHHLQSVCHCTAAKTVTFQHCAGNGPVKISLKWTLLCSFSHSRQAAHFSSFCWSWNLQPKVHPTVSHCQSPKVIQSQAVGRGFFFFLVTPSFFEDFTKLASDGSDCSTAPEKCLDLDDSHPQQ